MKGDVIVFSDNSNLEDKTDVIESMLLSELAADKKMYPTASEWLNFYQSVMGNIGWVSLASTGFTESTHESDDSKSHLHEVGKVVVNEIAKTTVGNKFSSKLTNFFNGLLNAGVESQELALFTEEHGKDKVRKNFFLAGAVDHDGNNPTLILVAIELNVDLSSAQTLFCQAKSFRYKVATLAAQLNKVVFDTAKETIETKLGDHLQTDVSPVSGSSTTDSTTPPTCPVIPANSSPSIFYLQFQIGIVLILHVLYKILQ